jgi:uncharacterized protein YciI
MEGPSTPIGLLLTYNYVPDMVTRNVSVFQAHVEHVVSYIPKGLLLAGPTTNPYDGGVLIFKGSVEVVEQFVKDDPYVAAGLVTEHSIKQFEAAVGEFASSF